FERIVRHCLEKRPEDRFQSTRDLVFDLETVSTAGFSETATLGLQSPEIIRRRQARRIPWKALAIFAILVALAGAFFLGRGSGPAKMPSYHQLTFRRGTVW